jgi:small-conductance mechanosensitive channel
MSWRSSLRAASIALAILLPPAAALAQPAAEDTAAASAAPVPLVFQDITLTTFRATLAGIGPAVRASTALERLEALRPAQMSEPIRIETLPEGRALFVGSTLAFGILQDDLDARISRDLDQEAEAARERLSRALRARARQWTPAHLVRSVVYSLLATAVLVFLIWLLLRLRRAALAFLTAYAEGKRRLFSWAGFDFTSTVSGILQWSTRIAAVVVGIVIFEAWLTFVLHRFPWTQPWARGARAFLLGTLQQFTSAILGALPGLISVVLILVLARFVARLASEFFTQVERGALRAPGIHLETASATRRLVNVLIWVFAVVLAYPFIPGSQSDVFKGVSVFVGLLFTLGSAGFVGHMMSGLVLVYSRALKPGDYVRVGEVEGFVTEVGTLSVKLANLRDEEFTVPNTVMVSSVVKNFTRLEKERGSPLTTSVTIGYDAPWRVVHEMLLGAAARTPGLRKQPPPAVLQSALSDFYVEYQLVARLEDPRRRPLVLSQLHQNIQDAFNERGVQIMSPHFEGQPDRPVVVPKSRWNTAPGDAPAEPRQ